MLELKSEENVLSGYLPVVKGIHVDELGQEVPRMKVVRPDASAVLLYNTDLAEFILVEQYRYPTSGSTIEIIAGKVDDGETPEQAAVRELKEEVGYEITEDRLNKVVSIYPSPGYAQETIHIYAASVTNADKVSDGGGVALEHEDVKILTFNAVELLNNIESGNIKDAKTICAITIQALKLSL
jgi:GDP-mannose pyrophosphatase NudK